MTERELKYIRRNQKSNPKHEIMSKLLLLLKRPGSSVNRTVGEADKGLFSLRLKRLIRFSLINNFITLYRHDSLLISE